MMGNAVVNSTTLLSLSYQTYLYLDRKKDYISMLVCTYFNHSFKNFSETTKLSKCLKSIIIMLLTFPVKISSCTGMLENLHNLSETFRTSSYYYDYSVYSPI